ncbi:TPA: hypothetical protein K8E22_004036 [Enterobacter cloacae]|nr:hypothetical protein [Enterobacter pasteurii]
MKNNHIHIAVVNNSKIVEAAEVNVDTSAISTTVQPVIVKAIAGGKYLLTEDVNGTAPENITVKRVGHNLWISFEGEDLDHPGLIIEDFYDYDGEVIGKGEDGSYHEYIASDARDAHEAAALLSGDSSALVLGTDNVVGVGALVAPVGMISPVWMGLLGLLVAGGAAAALAGGGGGGGGGDNSGGSNADSNTGATDDTTVAPVAVVPPATQITQVSDDAGAVHGSVVSGGLTDDNTPTLTGKSDPNVTIAIYDNGSKIGDVVTDNNGVWVFTPTIPLEDGTHSFTSMATDAAGNSGAQSDPWDVTIDATAPDAPLISVINDDVAPATGSIVSGGVTDDNTPTVSGQGTPGDTITITDGGTPIGTAIVDGSGNWTFTPDTPLTDGEHDLAVTATDPAGNVSAPSAIYPIIVNTTPQIEGAPLLTDDVGKVSGTIVSGDTTDDNLPDYSGKTEPGAEVIIRDNGTEIGRVKADDAGNWSFSPETPLDDGEHSFTAQPLDVSGNVGDESVPTDFVVDTVPLAVTILNATDDVSPVTGELTSGQATNDATPTLNGTATPGATVNVYDGGILLGTVTATPEGGWTLTPSISLAEGEHDFTATASSSSQGETDPTPVFALTIDTTPPDTPVTDINDDVGAIVGPVAPGGLTDDNQPTLSGTGIPGDTITITDGDTPLGTAIVNDTGAWTFTPDKPLVDGKHDLGVSATDPAGNESVPATVIPIIIDTLAPDVPVITGVMDDVDALTGAIAEAGLTNDPQPAISGTAEANSTVTVYIDGSEVGTTKASDSGDWTFTPETDVADGTHQITASAADAAGNISELSNAWSVVIDTVSETPVITTATDDVAGILGDISNGGLTNDNLPVINGTAEHDSMVSIYIDNVMAGTVQADTTGTWAFTVNNLLSDGTHQFSAIAVDAAGNTSSQSASWGLTVDTVAPASSILYASDDAGADSGLVYDGEASDDTRPTFIGNAEAGSNVTIFIDGVETGTTFAGNKDTWSYTPTYDLETGQHTIQVLATDAAGNNSEKTPDFTISVEPLEAALQENLSDKSEVPVTGVKSFLSQLALSGPTATEDKLSLSMTDNHNDISLSVNAETVQGNGAAGVPESKGTMLSSTDVLAPEQESWRFDDAGTVQKGEASRPSEPHGNDKALPVADQHLNEVTGDHYSTLHPTGSDLTLLLQQQGGIH